MSDPGEARTPAPGSAGAGPGWKLSLLICVVIVTAGAALLAVVYLTQPEASRGGAVRQTAMLVDVERVQQGTYRPTVVVTGTVRPARSLTLRPRVGGQVLGHAESLVPGGLVARGRTLVELDPADYRHALRQRRNELDQALAQLRIEQGRQRVAEQEYVLLGRELDGENRALVLRQPQLDSAQASVESARTAVDRAQLELARASVEAPFDAQVLERQIDVGSQVAAGDALARLVGTQSYWVEAAVPVSKLRWLKFPGPNGEEGAAVEIRNQGAWPAGVHRRGRLFRLVGSLDDATRMARVLIAVDDPLGLDSAAGKPRLLLGTFVEARIAGRRLDDVVRLPRAHVRRDGTVWVMADGALDIREVEIAVQDSQYAYVTAGLTTGDRVVTSSLATIREGAPLRLDGDDPRVGEAGE